MSVPESLLHRVIFTAATVVFFVKEVYSAENPLHTERFPWYFKVLLSIITGLGYYLVYHFFSSKIKSRDEQILERQEKILGKMIIQDLGRLPGYKKNLTLKEMLSASNDKIRLRAVEILKKELIGEDEFIAFRITKPFLRDKNDRVRSVAVQMVYKYNKNLALETIKDMTNDSNIRMRLSAAWAIGEIGDFDAIPFLDKLLNDSSKLVAGRSADILKKMRDSWKINDDQRSRIDRILNRE